MPCYKCHLTCHLLFTCFNTCFLFLFFFGKSFSSCVCFARFQPLSFSSLQSTFSSLILTVLCTQPFTCTITRRPHRSLSWSFIRLQGLNLFGKFFCVLLFLAIFFLFWFIEKKTGKGNYLLVIDMLAGRAWLLMYMNEYFWFGEWERESLKKLHGKKVGNRRPRELN